MSFAENHAALAREMRVSEDVQEESLKVIAYRFDDGPIIIADAGNRKSRLFLDSISRKPDTESVACTELDCSSLREKAEPHFDEIWNDRPGEGAHRFLDGIRAGQHLYVYSKEWTDPDVVDALWHNRDTFSKVPNHSDAAARLYIDGVLLGVDEGILRAAEKIDGEWVTHEWIKKAILLSFRLNANQIMGPDSPPIHHDALGPWWDKVPNKFDGWIETDFTEGGFRAVPGSIVRHGAFIGKNAILMPSFVNIGAYVDEGTMIDTWATIGSCAQIGKNCHISGGVGIGGVLEPLQANPTIIEDNCFIGARSEVVEGVVVRKGAVLSMGVFIGKNTPIVDRTKDNAITRGEVPENAVVMMGVHPENGLICPQIVKYRDEGTDAATALNSILRD